MKHSELLQLDIKLRRIWAKMDFYHDFASDWKTWKPELEKTRKDEDAARLLHGYFRKLLKAARNEMEAPGAYGNLKKLAMEAFEYGTRSMLMSREIKKDLLEDLDRIGGRTEKRLDTFPEDKAPPAPKPDKGKQVTGKGGFDGRVYDLTEKYALWGALACLVLWGLVRLVRWISRV